MKLTLTCRNLSLIMTLLLAILLCCLVSPSSQMKCRKNSRCGRDSCCLAVNRKDGVCSPKITLGKRCHPPKLIFLSNGGFAMRSCGCASGLTCTKVVKKRKNRRRNKKKNKKAYKIRYKCLPLPKQNRELSEMNRNRNFNYS